MEKETLERKLPSSIILEDEYRKCRATWMSVLGNAQMSYEELLNDKDVGDSLPAFEKLNSSWIKNFVSKKIDAVMQSPNTYSARDEAANEWRELEKDLLQKVENIENVRTIGKDAKIEVRGCHITINNLEELLRSRTEFVVPEEFKKFYDEVVLFKSALIRFHGYIQENWEMKIPLTINCPVLGLDDKPEEFVKYCIGWNKQREYEIRLGVPSSLAQQVQAHRDEIKRKEEQRRKRIQDANDQLVKEGKQAEYGVSIVTIDGKITPVRGKKTNIVKKSD